MVNVNLVMYLCCRVTHKEGEGLLYTHQRWYIRIVNPRYVRLLCPYLSAAYSTHIDDTLVPSRNVLRYPISGYQWSLSYVSYSLINCESHVSYSWIMFQKPTKVTFQSSNSDYIHVSCSLIIVQWFRWCYVSNKAMFPTMSIHMYLTHWVLIQSFR